MNETPLSSAPDSTVAATTAEQTHRPKVRRLLSNRKGRWIVGSALIGLAAGCAASASPSATSSTTATSSAAAPVSSAAAPASSAAPAASGRPGPGGGAAGGGGSNARSGPAEGGAAGTVGTVSASGFTLSTSAGQKVTVNEASSTTYQNGTTPISATAITQGETVLVLGTTHSTTITAAQVIVQPTDGGGAAASSAAGVVPFQQGAPTTSKSVGQIPANYVEGSGTIVSGATADSATEAALAAYPGGVVDRVVQLSNGEYEVHYIGVDWPHHIFVSQDFKVLGAG
jgi:hypothetical protein